MSTVTRIIGNESAARIKAALLGHVRYALRVERDSTLFIFREDEAEAAAEIIAAELQR